MELLTSSDHSPRAGIVRSGLTTVTCEARRVRLIPGVRMAKLDFRFYLAPIVKLHTFAESLCQDKHSLFSCVLNSITKMEFI